ncbi:2Fe-2S iron-sulfur cluster-binding protein [Pseudomaricurvus alkylphenolicus]|uniref:2Fe-2S iron-sulfur cluster-binding protein n=1 Tax=Pseudomaricurvus alkylphenolicus TaxID=1306991 RepID=UPI001981DC66|nr:2Fe-2S iron-sulfur cluster binding domain-containing protein [Pseudomaricurvus alkylphenolicus]
MMPLHCKVTLDNYRESFDCRTGESLLRGMERLGHKGIPVGCRNGGCGVCKVRVTRGEYEVGKMSRDHVSEDEQNQGVVLACRCHPRGDLQLQVLGHLTRIIEKSHSFNKQNANN